MNIRITLYTASMCALLVGVSGCSKQEETTPVSTPKAGDAATGAVQKAATDVKAQTETVKQAVQATATNVQAQAAAVTNRVQGIIDQATKLIGENKMSEAMALLNGLTGQQLTPAQQSMVQQLKEQIQKAGETAIKAKATDEATKAAGGLLQPKK